MNEIKVIEEVFMKDSTIYNNYNFSQGETCSLYMFRVYHINELIHIIDFEQQNSERIDIGKVIVAKEQFPDIPNYVYIEIKTNFFSYDDLIAQFGEIIGGRMELLYETEKIDSNHTTYAIRNDYEENFNKYGIELKSKKEIINAFALCDRGWEIFPDEFSFSDLLNNWDNSLEHEYTNSVGEYSMTWPAYEKIRRLKDKG